MNHINKMNINFWNNHQEGHIPRVIPRVMDVTTRNVKISLNQVMEVVNHSITTQCGKTKEWPDHVSAATAVGMHM